MDINLKYTRKILDVFKEESRDILSGKYILTKVFPIIKLYPFVNRGILEVNPGEDEESIDEYYNNYALTKYYKRLITLEKIQND